MLTAPYILRCFFVLIALWFIILGLLSFVMESKSRYSQNNDIDLYKMASIPKTKETAELFKRIDGVLKEVEELKLYNGQLRKLLVRNSADIDNENVKVNYLSSEYEKTRRILENDLKEMWYNVRTKRVNIGEPEIQQIEEVYKQLRAHVMKLRASDGYESTRANETAALTTLIQKRISDLQNPKDCDRARKLICTLNKGCGFGCQIHHVGYCLIVAYATSRTLILQSHGWRYNRQGWEKVFLPVSNTCTNPNGASRSDWGTGKHNVQVLNLPIVDFLKPRPPYLPVAVPSDLAEQLERIHGEPHVFWVGQFMKYLLRLQPETSSNIEESKRQMGFETPIVGIHIRRTDKIGTEASFHSLKEYMDHASDYFDILDNLQDSPLKRRVFIASDDASVLSEAANKYSGSDWEILGDKSVAQSASLSQRYYALQGIIKDVFLLSECDIVVCTFSSQVCRLAYEIMQTKHPDASQKFISLDDVYYYGGGSGVIEVAKKSHQPRNDQEIELKNGDVIRVAGNHWNGMSKGTNSRTNRMGLFPSHKVRSAPQHVDFPIQKWWHTLEP